MLGLSDKTLPGLPGLKPSSNSVLPVAWITRPATDLRRAGVVLIRVFWESEQTVITYSKNIKVRLNSKRMKNFEITLDWRGGVVIILEEVGLYSSWCSIYWNTKFNQNIILNSHVLKIKVRYERVPTI